MTAAAALSPHPSSFLRALQGLDVALYQCLHHLGVLAVICFERLLLPVHSRQPVTPLAAVGLAGILVGAAVASTGESFQPTAEGGATLTAYVAMGAAVSETRKAEEHRKASELCAFIYIFSLSLSLSLDQSEIRTITST